MATIFTLQETHFSKKGKVQIENMQIYESIRKKEHGTMLGVHVSHQPVLISEYSDKFEMIVVEIKVSNQDIRIITAYGPQENLDVAEIMQFFATLEQEIVSANMSNKSIIIQMDASSKLGSNIVSKDVHNQTANGAALAGIIERNALVVVNSLNQKVKGDITRRRVTVDGIEESIIDFVIISNDLVDDVKELIIDEQKEYALSKIVKGKHSTQVHHSDHNVMISKFSVNWNNEEPEKEEVFNLKNKQCQQKFKDETTNTFKLSNIFDKDDDLEGQAKKFLKLLKRCLHKCFKKVKIRNENNSEYEKLYKKWKEVRNKDDTTSKEEAKELEEELADKYAEGIFKLIKTEIENIKHEKGGLNSGNLWKLKNKLNKKYPAPPTAMKDEHGNLLTGKKEILEHTVQYYKKVLEHRPIKAHLTEHQKDREELSKKRMKLASQNTTEPWSIEDLDIVLKGLKQTSPGTH